MEGVAPASTSMSARLRTYTGKLGTGPAFERLLVQVHGLPTLTLTRTLTRTLTLTLTRTLTLTLP